METIKIKLATLINRLPQQPRKNVNLFFLVNIGGIVNTFKSDPAAHRWLKNMGYTLNDDCATYSKTRKSVHELEVERKYEIFNVPA